MIFDINGNEKNQVFGLLGESLTQAYDIYGNELIEESDYSIDNVISYYQQPTLDMVEVINAQSSDTVSFVVITDSHGSVNRQHSQAIATYLVKHSKANKLFHLGDVSGNNWSETEYKTYFTPLVENCLSRMYFTLGNHEWFGDVTHASHTVIYNDILSSKKNLHGNPERFYYYFDDASNKIRYVVINTSENSANSFSTTQATWLSESLVLPSNDWKAIVLGHIDIMPNDPITSKWESNQARRITDAIKSTQNTVIGYFCGHEHFDRIVKIEDSFYQINMLNDSCSQDTSFTEITNPTRKANTVSEQSVSIVSINLTTGDVVIRKIGASNGNMEYNYYV